jgi:hypothetical protein
VRTQPHTVTDSPIKSVSSNVEMTFRFTSAKMQRFSSDSAI